jgi:ribose transport system permease protein
MPETKPDAPDLAPAAAGVAPSTDSVSGPDHGPIRVGSLASSLLAKYSLILVLIAIGVFFSIIEPDTFPTWSNVTAMLSSQSVALLLALAVLIPLRAGDFDLSIAATMVFASTMAPLVWGDWGLPLPAAIVLTLMFGAAVGLANSFFVVGLGINAFVVTLGSMTLLGGLTTWVTGGELVNHVPTQLISFARTDWLGIPAAVYYGWALAIILYFVFEYTPVGRYLLFLGGNPEASRLAGISVKRVRTGAFVAAGLISSIAGIILVGKIGVADPTVGPSYLLPPYAAAFLGLAAVQLGRFNVMGTVIAVYLLTVATTGLLLLGAEAWVSEVFNGAALLLAVSFARLVRGGANE